MCSIKGITRNVKEKVVWENERVDGKLQKTSKKKYFIKILQIYFTPIAKFLAKVLKENY